jgi:hypothetical protein
MLLHDFELLIFNELDSNRIRQPFQMEHQGHQGHRGRFAVLSLATA